MQQTNAHIKKMNVAGQFYERDYKGLWAEIDRCFQKARRPIARPYKGVIVPHAGYRFSGPVAASVFASLSQHGQDIKTIVILAPSHRDAFKGLAVPSVSAFETPFGPVPVSTAGVVKALSVDGVLIRDQAFAKEHAIEVELPFIKRLMPHVSIVPIVVGECSGNILDMLMETLWGGSDTLIMISSDLSHYHRQDRANEMDHVTLKNIETYQSNIDQDHACGHRPLNAFLRKAQKLAMRPFRLDYRTSGDMSGDHDKVVGYSAYGFENASQTSLPDPMREELLRVAKNVIAYGVQKGKPPEIDLKSFASVLQTHMACFVTLTQNGQLRGCIGSYVAQRPLLLDVAHNAYAAAFQDKRFKPLTSDDLSDLELSISILAPPKALLAGSAAVVASQLQPDRHGLILRGEEGKQALYLPSVWRSLPKVQDFIDQLMRKADMSAGEWPKDMKAWSFTAESF